MTNTIFNTLLISVNEFILTEQQRPNIIDIAEKVSYYRGVVEEYYYLNNTLNDVKLGLNNSDLIHLINTNIEMLNITFNNYKTNITVQDTIIDIESTDERLFFFNAVRNFEKNLMVVPLIKIDQDTIQSVMDSVNSFADVANKYYFFEHNPYQIDETYNIVIPVKYEFKTKELFVNHVYNYLFGIYNTYSYQNKSAIELMLSNEQIILARLNEFQNHLISKNNNKLDDSLFVTSNSYYIAVIEIMDIINVLKKQIIDMDIARYYELSDKMAIVLNQLTILEDYYFNKPLYIEELNKMLYSEKMIELQDNVYLIEKGIIDVDKSYIISEETSFKNLIDEIISMSQELKMDIYYTQQFDVSGQPLLYTFTFYQTSDFLKNIKAYYYRLMTNNSIDFNEITIHDFGDDTTIALRNLYIESLSKYKDFATQPTEYLIESELINLSSLLADMQIELKRQAATFFNNSIETSPLTYVTSIEREYKLLIDNLEVDLKYFNNLVISFEYDDNLREQALTILNKSIKYYNSLIELSIVDKQYVMLGMDDYIKTYLISFFEQYKTDIISQFNQQNYIGVINSEEIFYKTSAVNHNAYVSLGVLSSSIDAVFSQFNELQNIFTNEQISRTPIDRDNTTLTYINSLYADNNLNILRVDISNKLDDFYNYVIAKRPNEKPFLINEKNLKMDYFDNTIMKSIFINLFDLIVSINLEYNEELTIIGSSSSIVNEFTYAEQLESLISNINVVISTIARMIAERDLYSTSTTFTDIINVVNEYSLITMPKIEEYENELLKYREIIKNQNLTVKKDALKLSHKTEWLEILNGNNIAGIKQISYNDLETIQGTVPFSIELSADFNIVNDEDEPEFIWDIAGVILTGKEVSHTIYTEGTTRVSCSRVYPSGESTVRYVDFEISGPTNSQVVKSTTINYAPIAAFVDQPKITYFDSTTNTQITIPINIDGSLIDMLGEGSISLSESGEDLQVEKAGMVILGYEGSEIAGAPFDYTTIFAPDFEMPTEGDFLFDFQISDPVANKSVIDISKSNLIDYIAKVPLTKAVSVYDISDASEFQSFGNAPMPIIVGDIIVMKNKAGKYAVIKIDNMSSEIDLETSVYSFEIVFNVNVNVSLNKYEQTQFKPLSTNYVVPTLIFETNSKELFSSLIERIEQINVLTTELNETIDNERKVIIDGEIKELHDINNRFYLFSEYNRLKSKTSILTDRLSNVFLADDFNALSLEDMQSYNTSFALDLNETQSFSDYINGTNLYDFRNNVIDLEILTDLYLEEQLMMNVILKTFDYISYDMDYFKALLRESKYTTELLLDESQYDGLSYSEQLLLIVKNARTHLFRLKLLINLPILIAGKYIIPTRSFDREVIDVDGNITEIDDIDLYLLNKKIELKYGLETKKLITNDDNLITDLTNIVKDVQGNGLSDSEKTILGKYINAVERKCVIEYDDFFMLPYWIDYLTKLL